jgi:chromosome segregation ATPase
MRVCPFCQGENPDAATMCTSCARPLSEGAPTVETLTPPPDPSGYAPVPPAALPQTPVLPSPLLPMPRVPDRGWIEAVKYVLAFLRARWQRRRAIHALADEIKDSVRAMDEILVILGKEARAAKLSSRSFAEENQAIDAAEAGRATAVKALGALSEKKADEAARFEENQRDLAAKVAQNDELVQAAERALVACEQTRRALLARRKELQARREAPGAAGPELARTERELADADRAGADAKTEAGEARVTYETSRRMLEDAREGHRHRAAEIEAERGRASRELLLAEQDIQRRLATLGTLVNLHRVDGPQFSPNYTKIDALRAGIGAREQAIDRLTAESDAYDRASLLRGASFLFGALLVVITLICAMVALTDVG